MLSSQALASAFAVEPVVGRARVAQHVRSCAATTAITGNNCALVMPAVRGCVPNVDMAMARADRAYAGIAGRDSAEVLYPSGSLFQQSLTIDGENVLTQPGKPNGAQDVWVEVNNEP